MTLVYPMVSDVCERSEQRAAAGSQSSFIDEKYDTIFFPPLQQHSQQFFLSSIFHSTLSCYTAFPNTDFLPLHLYFFSDPSPSSCSIILCFISSLFHFTAFYRSIGSLTSLKNVLKYSLLPFLPYHPTCFLPFFHPAFLTSQYSCIFSSFLPSTFLLFHSVLSFLSLPSFLVKHSQILSSSLVCFVPFIFHSFHVVPNISCLLQHSQIFFFPFFHLSVSPTKSLFFLTAFPIIIFVAFLPPQHFQIFPFFLLSSLLPFHSILTPYSNLLPFKAFANTAFSPSLI